MAIIPFDSGAVIEFSRPVKIENPVEKMTLDRALAMVVEHLRDYRGPEKALLLKELKRELSFFDARELTWK